MLEEELYATQPLHPQPVNQEMTGEGEVGDESDSDTSFCTSEEKLSLAPSNVSDSLMERKEANGLEEPVTLVNPQNPA